MKYINVEKFAKDVEGNIGTPEMDDAFDALYTEFEQALYQAIDMNYIEKFKEMYKYGLNKMIEEIKKFKKPETTVIKPIINLNDAVQDTIDDLKEDAKLFKK